MPSDDASEVVHNRAAESVRVSLPKKLSIFQMRARYVIRMFRQKVKEQIAQVMNT